MTTQAKPVPARPAPPPVLRRILVTSASGYRGCALAAEHPGVRLVVLDTDAAAIDRAHDQITAEPAGHGLDVLGNAAGILALGPVESVPDQQTRALLRSTTRVNA